jgi:hypothetical protein
MKPARRPSLEDDRPGGAVLAFFLVVLLLLAIMGLAIGLTAREEPPEPGQAELAGGPAARPVDKLADLSLTLLRAALNPDLGPPLEQLGRAGDGLSISFPEEIDPARLPLETGRQAEIRNRYLRSGLRPGPNDGPERPQMLFTDPQGRELGRTALSLSRPARPEPGRSLGGAGYEDGPGGAGDLYLIMTVSGQAAESRARTEGGELRAAPPDLITLVYRHVFPDGPLALRRPPEPEGPDRAGRPENIQALFLDPWGNYREDSNANGVMEAGPLTEPGSNDRLVEFKAPPGAAALIRRGVDLSGDGLAADWETLAGPEDLAPLWVFGGIPAPGGDRQLIGGRDRRPVYTWRPGSEAEAPDQSELRPLKAEAAAGLAPLSFPGRRPGGAAGSRPIVAGPPAAAFDALYGDYSYARFKKTRAPDGVAGRRQVAYLADGQGLLRAVNLGFFGLAARGRPAYSEEAPPGKGPAPLNRPAPALGAELWALAPPSLLAAFKEASPEPGPGPDFSAELKFTVVDLKNSGPDRPFWASGQWRTVLIGVLRPEARAGRPGPTEYFALDVTDPEKEPRLLWSGRDSNFRFSGARPALAANSGRQAGRTDWYVILAGSFADEDRAGLLVLDALSGQAVPAEIPLRVGEAGGFFHDSFTPLAPAGPGDQGRRGTEEAVWSHNTAYFSFRGADGQGAVYRLQMVGQPDGNAPPYPRPPEKWRLTRLFHSPAPLSGPVNAAFDRQGRQWVFFMTGRPLRAPAYAPGYLYGLKEPLGPGRCPTFGEVEEFGPLMDLGRTRVYHRGRLEDAPDGFKSFESLAGALSGEAYAGYRRPLGRAPDPATDGEAAGLEIGEIGLGQVKIEALADGRSVLAFTSHRPPADGRPDKGRSFLNLADSFTGLPAPPLYPLGFEAGEQIREDGRVHYQVTGRIEAGPGPATEASVIRAGRVTLVKNRRPDGADNLIYIPEGLSRNSAVISWREVLNPDF